MTDLNALSAANAKRWKNAKLTRSFAGVAKRLVAPEAKARYQAVKKRTGVPWALIAVAHERECSQNWSGSLAQGDPWNRVSVHVPAGRGPFKSWEDAAVDALVNCPPRAARNKDWSIAGALTKLEEYNGLGYAARGKASPYIWSGTDQYKSGKYVRDGVYDPEVVDSQFGCAGLLLAMMALDPTITFTGLKLTPTEPRPLPVPAAKPAPVAPSAAPSISHPSKGIHRCIHRLHSFHRIQKEMTMRSLLDVVLFAAGYIAATYSRPSIRMWVNGARAEIASFRAMAALESSIRVR